MLDKESYPAPEEGTGIQPSHSRVVVPIDLKMNAWHGETNCRESVNKELIRLC